MHISRSWGISVFGYGLLGGLLGFGYGWYRVLSAMQYMREKWGWVCGTGLHFPLYFWSTVGAICGCVFGALLYKIFQHFSVRNEA